MALRKYRSLLTLLMSSFLLLLLSACNGPGLANAANQSLATSSANQMRNMSLAVSNNCPAPGTGRAAVLPPLTLGKDQNVVYTSNTYISLSSALKRYDTLTGKTTTILTLAHKNIIFDQVSADGQWILFVSGGAQQSQTPNKIQLVRMDGRYLQTLYCSANAATTINSIQWSTDRKLIVFDFINSGTQNVDVLNTTNGNVQTDLSLPMSSVVFVRTWLDTTRIYVTNMQTDAPPNIIYLLDTKKGANQKLSNVPVVFNGTFGDFDSSYNGKSLYTSSCNCGMGGNSGPGTITVMPATGGQAQTLYSSNTDAITTVRAVLPTTLLFTVYDYNNGNTSDNGLWRINTDGTGLTRLTTDTGNQISSLNNSSQFPWSNVSRDGSTYSLLVLNGPMGSLEIGAISGGTPTTIATYGSSGPFLDFVGWTTM